MKQFILLLLLIQSAHAQRLDSINKIVIDYSIGHTSWAKSEVYGRREYFEFTPAGKDNFTMSKVLRMKYKKRGERYLKDTTRVSTAQFHDISNQKISFLLDVLGTHEDNFTEDFLLPKLKKPGKRMIRKLAKEDYNESYFEKEYESKEEIAYNYNLIESFSGFKEYLGTIRPSLDYSITTIDAWNYVRINIITRSNDTIKYSADFFNTLGQPFQKQVATFDKNQIEWKQTINLNMNLALKAILPPKSRLSKAVELDGITVPYIIWFIKNKEDEFK